jgi:hypothetical protein
VKPTAVAATVAIAVSAVLAACDRQAPPSQATGGTTARSVPGSPPGAPSSLPNSSVPTTPPAATERQSNVQPIEGREDTRQVEQRRDFKHPEEKAGPQKSG